MIGLVLRPTVDAVSLKVNNISFKKAEGITCITTAILRDNHNSTETTTVRGTMDREAKQRSSNHAISLSLARSLIQTVDASTNCTASAPCLLLHMHASSDVM
jgi:hypothetical protein